MANQAPTSSRPTQDLTQKARDLGRGLKDQASELADSATETVKTQAGNLSASARELASDASERIRTAAADQKTAGADYIGNFAEMVRRSSYEFDSQMPQAGHYIRKAAAQIDTASTALRTRDLGELLGEVQQFARQQPVAFFGAAVLAGFAAVRFFKSAPASASAMQGSGTSSSGQTLQSGHSGQALQSGQSWQTAQGRSMPSTSGM